MAKRTLLDELQDPASWAGAPLGFAPPQDVYLNARLIHARAANGDLIITIESGNNRFHTTLLYSNFMSLTASQAVDILTPYFGGLLLTALAHEMDGVA